MVRRMAIRIRTVIRHMRQTDRGWWWSVMILFPPTQAKSREEKKENEKGKEGGSGLSLFYVQD